MTAPAQTEDGKWTVDGRVFETNAKAWRYIDRKECEPVNSVQDRHDWSFNNLANREFGGS